MSAPKRRKPNAQAAAPPNVLDEVATLLGDPRINAAAPPTPTNDFDNKAAQQYALKQHQTPTPATPTAEEVWANMTEARLETDDGQTADFGARLTDRLNALLAARAASPDSGRATLTMGAESGQAPAETRPSSGNAGSAQLPDSGRVEREHRSVREAALQQAAALVRRELSDELGTELSAEILALIGQPTPRPDALTLERVRAVLLGHWTNIERATNGRLILYCKCGEVFQRQEEWPEHILALLAAPRSETK